MTPKGTRGSHAKDHSRKSGKVNGNTSVDLDSSDDDRMATAEKRMKAVVRSQGRLLKKNGVMMSLGASEFQIASGDLLHSLRP